MCFLGCGAVTDVSRQPTGLVFDGRNFQEQLLKTIYVMKRRASGT